MSVGYRLSSKGKGSHMDATFDELEERVSAAIQAIATLREEKGELIARQKELEAQLGELGKEKKGLQRQINKLEKNSVDRGEFARRKKQIETRVEGLLTLFSGLEETG